MSIPAMHSDDAECWTPPAPAGAPPAADGAAAAAPRPSRAAEIEPIADRLIGTGGSADELAAAELESAARDTSW